ncbi:MAG: adenine deaminase, partial [Clostridia bacterium]|nr:adenine deaminase [Clostridia bacterium]
MINHFCKWPLWECSTALVDVAMGRRPADLVVRGAQLVNVCTREILPDTDVAVVCGRIARVGDCADTIGPDTRVIDAGGKYLAPAFLDGHIHIESSMLTAGEYARAVVPHGPSGVFADPHEICNVLGLFGVRCMLDDAAGTPLKVMMTTPSCVPAVPGFEDTGAHIGPEEVRETMSWEECVGLGEMMNFPGVIYAAPETHAIVGETLRAGKTVTGHYSMPETGKGLNAYIAAGVRCCHESTREEDALAKMRMGMYALIREGSAWHDLREVIRAVTRHEVDSRYACLISDDTHPETLRGLGHLDHIVRRAIEEGCDPVTAIQMVTVNVATCFGLDHEMGSIAPSKCADMVLIDDLTACHVTDVFVNGDHVAKDGRLTAEVRPYTYPAQAVDSVKMARIGTRDLRIGAAGTRATVRVIEVIPAKVGSIERLVEMPVSGGEIKADGER